MSAVCGVWILCCPFCLRATACVMASAKLAGLSREKKKPACSFITSVHAILFDKTTRVPLNMDSTPTKPKGSYKDAMMV